MPAILLNGQVSIMQTEGRSAGSNRMRRWFFSLRYLSRPPWDTGIPAPELVRAVEGRTPGRALDIGCGTGTNLRFLAERGWDATGVDFAAIAIERARRKLKGLRVILLVADATKLSDLPLHEPFDLALDIGCFHGLPPEGRLNYAAGLAKWVKPGGQYLLYAFQPEGAAFGIPRREVESAFARNFRLTNYEQGKGRASAWYYFERI
jgi:SAM-dependent methyltransferase